ncbi:porin family protein [Microvirga sp. BT688]|uniref:outer membrane protein n=1 Tax=Microvirga sp. TaxID=1873136 RepID=UPI00168585F6|nr:outer membrane protein [Microvirga sp.]MBD2745802.1 porin family protein [Microvirga sp.]
MKYRSFLSLAACAAMAMFALPAAAADLPYSAQPVPGPAVRVASTSFSWTGFYAGVNGGYGWSHEDNLSVSSDEGFFFNNPAFEGFHHSDGDGFAGGAQIGYNYQLGSFLVGLEADVNYADLESAASGSLDQGFTVESLDARSKLDWFGTVRARVGFIPVNRVLVYATGGLAYGSVEVSAVDTATYNRLGRPGDVWTGNTSDTKFGWTIGAGAEYALTDNLILRGEALYVDLGKTEVTGTYTGDFDALAEDTFVATSDTKFTVVRAGLNYKF